MGIGKEITVLKKTECENDVGVSIDKDFVFEQHSQHLTAAGNRLVGIMRRTFSHIGKITFKYMYKGLSRPQLHLYGVR